MQHNWLSRRTPREPHAHQKPSRRRLSNYPDVPASKFQKQFRRRIGMRLSKKRKIEKAAENYWNAANELVGVSIRRSSAASKNELSALHSTSINQRVYSADGTRQSARAIMTALVPSGIIGAGGSFRMCNPGRRKSNGDMDLEAWIPLQPLVATRASAKKHQLMRQFLLVSAFIGSN